MIKWKWFELVEWVFWVGWFLHLTLKVHTQILSKDTPCPQDSEGALGSASFSSLPCVAWTARHVLTTYFSGSICAHCSASALMGLSHSSNIISFLTESLLPNLSEQTQLLSLPLFPLYWALTSHLAASIVPLTRWSVSVPCELLASRHL